MLVLSRKSGERIVIGPNIELTILEVRGDRVHVGIKAPKDVSIHREEVYQRIHDARPCEAGSEKFPEILLNMNELNYGYSDGPS